jgi:hypothetical protein
MKKDWTILIYANGNNELEPEMWQSKIDAETIGSSENVNVVMQISRESRELVKIIRPKDSIPPLDETWTGARRYYVLQSESKLIRDLGNVNMADPHTLHDFTTWGIKNYPAKRYMLILSGHGGAFTAALLDLSQEIPYAMGVTEMCKVINRTKSETGANIDLLVLDICNMNSVEILYELGKDKVNTVSNVLTYINNGPISGMPYDKLIYTVGKNSLADTEEILKNIVDNIQLDLIAIKLDSGKLKTTKKIVNNMAYIYLTDEHKQIKSWDILNHNNKSALYNYFFQLNKELHSMIIHYKTTSGTTSGLINLTNLDNYRVFDDKYLSMYYKLSFAKNNYWMYVLGNKSINDKFNVELSTDLLPSRLQARGLVNLVRAMNPNFNEKEVYDVLKNLYKYKKWGQL